MALPAPEVGRGRGGVSLTPKFELPSSLEIPLSSLQYFHHCAQQSEAEEKIVAREATFFEILDWLRKYERYKDKGACHFPSNFAVIGSFFLDPPKKSAVIANEPELLHTSALTPEISPVIATKPGLFHTLSSEDCALPTSLSWKSNFGYEPKCEQHFLFLHESYAMEPELSLGSLTWTVTWVGGRFAAALLDFETFFTGRMNFDARAKYDSWMLAAPASGELERIRAAMPGLVPELEMLMSKEPTESLASLMLTMVRTSIKNPSAPVFAFSALFESLLATHSPPRFLPLPPSLPLSRALFLPPSFRSFPRSLAPSFPRSLPRSLALALSLSLPP